MKKILKVTGVLMVGLILGILIGGFTVSRCYEKFMVEPGRYEKAYLASNRVNTLSLLRLDAKAEAIKDLEMNLDIVTEVLTQNTNDPTKLPKDVVQALQAVKAYRNIYPCDGPTSATIARALANVSAPTFKEGCQAGICRLIDAKKQKPQP